jgi:two-component system, LuxR family, response regulator FixJ
MSGRTIYLVDDEEPIRKSVKLMLVLSGFSVTVFDSGRALLNVAEALIPGALLLDIRMPVMDGIQVQRHLLDRGVDLPVVVMTGHGDFSVAATALLQGAVAFLEKPFPKRAVLDALETAFLRLEDPDAYRERLAAAVAAVEGLDEEDRALLASLAAGLSNEAIAADLSVSPSVTELRRARLFGELGIGSITEALRMATAAGLGPRD